jgi:hypothetical protein
VAGASAAQIGQCRLRDFFARQIGWIENRRATHAHRLVPGMKIKSSGKPPARGVKSRCGFYILQQKVRFAASLQVVAVDLRRRKFRKLLFRHRNRCSLYRADR